MFGLLFSVSEDIVIVLYCEYYKVECIECFNLEGGLKGKVNVNNLVFMLIFNKMFDCK